MKVIPVESCASCPHRDHKGGFGVVAYVPVCRMANRELPHDVQTMKTPLGHRMVAGGTSVIPDWCPLSDAKDFV